VRAIHHVAPWKVLKGLLDAASKHLPHGDPKCKDVRLSRAA
jgi:hypothetical protein